MLIITHNIYIHFNVYIITIWNWHIMKPFINNKIELNYCLSNLWCIYISRTFYIPSLQGWNISYRVKLIPILQIFYYILELKEIYKIMLLTRLPTPRTSKHNYPYTIYSHLHLDRFLSSSQLNEFLYGHYKSHISHKFHHSLSSRYTLIKL